MLHTITRVAPHPGGRLHLTYASGELVEVDTTPMIHRGGVFAALADPTLFGRVMLGAGGRYVEWPGEVDLCADALWLAAHGRSGSEAA
jgi:hypothetical protein